MPLPSSKPSKTEHLQWQQLHPMDEALAKTSAACTITLTWLEAPIDTNIIRQRLVLLVARNPWLLGSLTKKRTAKGFRRYLGIEYPSLEGATSEQTSALVDQKGLFRETRPGDIDLHPDQPWNKQNDFLGKRYTHLVLLAGTELHSGPVFKVSVVPTADRKYIGLLVSLLHSVGDGHTYYKLFGALLGDDVPALRVERIMSTLEQQEGVLGKAEAQLGASNQAIILARSCAVAKGMLQPVAPTAWRANVQLYDVDPDKIAKLKVEATEKDSSVPFVSTNDILTHWLLRSFWISMMTANMRSRLSGHNDYLAGNYYNSIYLRQDDVATPAHVRRSVQNLRRTETSRKPLSAMEYRKCRLHVVTNWASFFPKTLDPSFKIRFHGPITDPNFTPLYGFFYIFRSKPDQISVMAADLPVFMKKINPTRLGVEYWGHPSRTADEGLHA